MYMIGIRQRWIGELPSPKSSVHVFPLSHALSYRQRTLDEMQPNEMNRTLDLEIRAGLFAILWRICFFFYSCIRTVVGGEFHTIIVDF